MSAVISDKRRDEIVAAFRKQIEFCGSRGASFTAAIIDAARRELEAGSVLLELMDNHQGDPWRNALPLRVAGGLHALALDGRASELAPFYKEPHVSPDTEQLRKAMSPLWERERAHFERYIGKAPQTNEVRRACALLPGFSKIAETTDAPLDLLELGSSAGLLLGWDRFQYNFGDVQWGNSSAIIETEWRGDKPAKFHEPISVRKRSGCDLHPFNLSNPAELLHARSYIWPEDDFRRASFDQAVARNASLSANVIQADALDWLSKQLPNRAKDAATVIFHSVFALYLSDQQRAQMQDMLEQAGKTATTDAPLAWLQFEPHQVGDDMEFFADLQIWPSGHRMRLVRAHPHCAWVEPLDHN